MAKYLEQIFPVKCKGRDRDGEEVLRDHVNVNVNIHQNPDCDAISSTVECRYNAGGHGERCIAAGPLGNPLGNSTCPYSFDIPYALEKKR